MTPGPTGFSSVTRPAPITVADRPERPLIVFDGDCGFCRQWVRRWKGMTGDRIDYRPYQEAAPRFPEIGESAFARRVWLIEPDGHARGGAGAVFRLYALVGERSWPEALYRHLPGFAGVSEVAYGVVARHRRIAAMAVRISCGSIDRRPSYRRARSIFLRGMGLVYLAAFGSLLVQVDGLIGSRGIAPAAEFLDRARTALGGASVPRVPTLFWLDASDRALRAVCWGGIVGSVLLIAGVLPVACLVGLWAAYLSFVSVGHPFLSYQWDALLLESGFLAILVAPWTLRLNRVPGGPPGLAVWLVRWLVFRLMFLSGVVKLTSADPTWAAWTAMKYHYETQPLPTWTSWYAHHLPDRLQRASVGLMFWAELIAPFLLFGPRIPRMIGVLSIVLLQLGIAATGNFGFFNLLSVVLCLLLVEDRDWGRKDDDPAGTNRRPILARIALAAIALPLMAVSVMNGIDGSGVSQTVTHPAPLERLRTLADTFRIANAYGLFAVMTTERPEILVEGSDDGEVWTAYRFRWKPGDPARRPRFCTTHLPRLDWQMWFAALSGDCRAQPWFLNFERRLLEGSPEVLSLLEANPFPDRPPRYLRARLDLYHFTRPGEPGWWTREEAGTFCPALGLRRGDGDH